MKRAMLYLFIALAGLLSGCASTWQVDSDVRTFSNLTAVPAGASYRFERLPSQQSHGEQQARVEAIVEQSLAKVGLRRDEAAAKFSVQIGARVQRESSPWEETWGGFGMGRDYAVTAGGQIVWVRPFMRPESPWYRREVSIVMRDLASNQVVYESHAAYDGTWADSPIVLPALFDSAVSDFPRSSQGVKKVQVTVPLR